MNIDARWYSMINNSPVEGCHCKLMAKLVADNDGMRLASWLSCYDCSEYSYPCLVTTSCNYLTVLFLAKYSEKSKLII